MCFANVSCDSLIDEAEPHLVLEAVIIFVWLAVLSY